MVFKINDFFATKFTLKRIYEKDLISNIFNNNEIYTIIVNIKGIFIMLFQIVITIYSIILIPELLLIKCLACNFKTRTTDISLDNRVQNNGFIMIILQLVYGFIYFIFKYTLCILPSLYYIFIDLDIKSRNNFIVAIKNLNNIIYYSNILQFTQIFFGKHYLNIVLYFFNKLLINDVIIYLSKTTDILFVKILEDLFTEFYRIPIISIYFPLKYLLKYIGISFKTISLAINNISKYLELILNVFALILCLIPFYSLYICFENDLKRILFIETPLSIYLIFNMWICGRTIKNIEEKYGSF